MVERNTRESQGGIPAEMALCIAGGQADAGMTDYQIFDTVNNIIKYFSLNDKYSILFDKTGYGAKGIFNVPPGGIPTEFEFYKNNKELVGILCSFTGVPHNIPYVRIGGFWYNGDNEFGYLRKMKNPPSVFFRYSDPYGKRHVNAGISRYIAIYCDPSQITETREDMTGFPTFGQSKNSCVSDSFQTILMQGDGLHEYFNTILFTEFKKKYAKELERYTSVEVSHYNPYTEKELTEFILSVKDLSFSPKTQSQEELYKYILLMFIRFASFETLPRREYKIMTDNSDIEDVLWYLPLLNVFYPTYNQVIDLSNRTEIPESDFIILNEKEEYIKELIILGCTQLTDNVFKYFGGIKSINMSGCNQATITDNAFINLRDIKSINMSGCNQATITDNAFINLKGIEVLNMADCNQATITDKAFSNLGGIKQLIMRNCNQNTITDEMFQYLNGIEKFNMVNCKQESITGKNMKLLGGNLKLLQISGCNASTIQYATQVFGISKTGPPTKYNFKGGSRKRKHKVRKTRKK